MNVFFYLNVKFVSFINRLYLLRVMKKVLAASWHTGSTKSILPVVKKLREESKVDLVLMAHDNSESIYEKESVDYNVVSDYGLNDVSLDSMKRIVGEESPDVVLTGGGCQDPKTKDVIEQTLTLAAKEYDIPSVSVRDNWKHNLVFFNDTTLPEDEGRFRFLSTYVTAIDERHKEILVEQGFPADGLVVTGNPSSDHLGSLRDNFTEEDSDRVRNDLGIGLDSWFVLYASQPFRKYEHGNAGAPDFFGFNEDTLLTDFVEGISKFDCPGFEVLVKAHPFESKEHLEWMVRERLGKNYPVVGGREYDTMQAISASDLVVSSVSNILVEATYLDKLAVSLQPGLMRNDGTLRRDDILITNEFGITPHTYTKDGVLSVIDKVMCDPDYKVELAEKRKEFSKGIGSATDKVCDFIYGL